jgi:hypothetical protein
MPSRIEATFEPVVHRQQLVEQFFVGEAARLLQIAMHAATLVFQLGALAQHGFAQLGVAGFQRFELALQCFQLGAWRRRIGGKIVVAIRRVGGRVRIVVMH